MIWSDSAGDAVALVFDVSVILLFLFVFSVHCARTATDGVDIVAGHDGYGSISRRNRMVRPTRVKGSLPSRTQFSTERVVTWYMLATSVLVSSTPSGGSSNDLGFARSAPEQALIFVIFSQSFIVLRTFSCWAPFYKTINGCHHNYMAIGSLC